MTEEDYIVVSDLARIRSAKSILSQIMSGTISVAPTDEYYEIFRILTLWEERANAKVSIEENLNDT